VIRPSETSQTTGFAVAARLAFAFSQHPDQHRAERPVLLAVDQELAGWTEIRSGPGALEHD
jgi:hypothetical protein